MAYAGFDADQFPGLATMAALAKETNLAWCGYYLTAPSHSNAGWEGNRAALEAMGWGVVPIYVGQQTTGPGSHVVSVAQGAADGQDCARKMEAEGFTPGTFCYLDLENGPPIGATQAGYVQAWCGAMRTAGFGFGVYCSHLLTSQVAAYDSALRVWAFQVPTTDLTTAAGPFETPTPEWEIVQYRQNVNIVIDGKTLNVDLDSSALPNPAAPVSAPATAPQAPPVPAPIAQPQSAPIAPQPAPLPTTQPSMPAAPSQIKQQSPGIAAAVSALPLASLVTTQAGAYVNFHALINAEWPLIVSGVFIPLVVYLVGRALQYLHINQQSVLAQDINRAAVNAANRAASDIEPVIEAHSEVDVKNAQVANAMQYVIDALPGKLAALGVSQKQLANLVTAKLAQLPTGPAQ